ncbi:hypothetical protein AVEN_237326-1 [Araneus ventricosus]|uniref:Uncharacterized protein n=1 Tax=Araneus ventricosus TaxID=182803 RepID=A0A4Y2IBW7_ARAVE|nr:hypothetical protein AVEN_237326-1 [Araneus ventricosus]
MSTLLAILKNCCESSSGKSGATPYSPDSAPNLGSEYLSGTRFSSDSDMKTVAENWLNGHGNDFYQAGLKRFVLSSDKCLHRFCDDVEK